MFREETVERTTDDLVLAPKYAPWEAEPYRIWSFLEMFRYRADFIALVSAALGDARANTGMAEKMPALMRHALFPLITQMGVRIDGPIDFQEIIGPPIADFMKKQNAEIVDTVDVGVERAGLPMRWRAKLKRLRESLDDPNSDTKTLEVMIGELLFDLIEELREPLFFVVPTDRRELYEQKAPPFGVVVDEKFQTARRDIAAASRCLALDEWTACVFHLMRVLEHGLRPLAVLFNVLFDTDSWHKVLRGIEDGLSALRNKQGLTAQERQNITNYSEAVSQFRYFKDAWRNHVSHGREHYDQKDAEVVWSHTRDFMQKMAEIL